MKKTTILGFAILLLTSVTNADTMTSKTDMTVYLNSLERSLNADNDGVQFWAMFHLAQLKSKNPEMDLSRFEWTLNRIIERENSELIGVNAKMTLLYINSTELAAKVKVADKENPFIFYTQLYFEKYKNKFGLENLDMAEQLKPTTDNATALNF